MERCSQCVLPLHLVKHNEQKVCEPCLTYEEMGAAEMQQREKSFHAIIESYKGRGKKYDFLVPLTGGKDSTFVLYYMTQVLGAKRVLAVTWDHLFHRPTSWDNIRKAIAITGVDHYVYHIVDADTTRAMIRAFFRRFGHTCMLCRLFLVPVIGIQAMRHEVPLIVSGENPAQARARGTHKEAGVISTRPEAVDRINTLSYLLRTTLADQIPERYPQIEKEILGTIGDALAKPDYAWPEFIDMGGFMDWYQEEESLFLKKLGDAFQFQKASETFTHTSCLLERMRGYQEYKFARINKTGYSSEISHFIRSGVLTREQGLAELEQLGMTDHLPECAEDYLRETGLTREEFLRHLGKPLPLGVKVHFAKVMARQKLRTLFSSKGRTQTRVNA